LEECTTAVEVEEVEEPRGKEKKLRLFGYEKHGNKVELFVL
jgi:hypothetical protein